MTTSTTTASLHRLSDTNLDLADPASDIRGRKVVDANGDDIGEVDDLLVDDAEKRVRFLQVASGGFLGIGATKFLIPVDAIRDIDDQEVHVDRKRERVAAAPPYNPQLVDRDYLQRVYGHYGQSPYWAPGYRYPGYPTYRSRRTGP